MTLTKRGLNYAKRNGLIEVDNPDGDKPFYRKERFGARNFHQMDVRMGKLLDERREEVELPMTQCAQLVGLSTSVYKRYEKAQSKLTVTRMIHLCEILGFTPVDLLVRAAPEMWGETEEEAQDSAELVRLIFDLPTGTKRDLLALIRKMSDLQTQMDGIRSAGGVAVSTDD